MYKSAKSAAYTVSEGMCPETKALRRVRNEGTCGGGSECLLQMFNS